MTEQNRDAAELLLANRFYLYSTFYKLFAREPDLQQLALLAQEQTCAALTLLSAEEGDTLFKAAAFLREIREQLGDPAFPEQVKGEYMRLFVGPDKLPAPPWESVYRGEDAVLFQKTTLEVRECYRAFGLLPEAYLHVADDSLALELAFLTTLAERAMQALSAQDEPSLSQTLEGSAHFLREHLLLWIPKFLERLKKAPSDYLYPHMCVILHAFLLRDCETLAELREAI